MNYIPYFFIDFTRSKFNLILSEQLGNENSKIFISNFIKDINNNEDFIYHSWYDNDYKNNMRTQQFNNLKEQIFQNINGNSNYDKNILFNNDDDYNNKNSNNDSEENKDNNKITKNPFENIEKLSEEYIKYSNELFNTLIKDQFLLNINNRSPLFLLGCRVPKDNEIECYNFSYNNDILNPEVNDYKNMHEIYTNLLSNLFLSFPCLIQDSLNHFLKYVSNDKFTEEKQAYHVGFFILTNHMNDINYLFEFLLNNNNLPFSIIIISLGDEFKSDEFESKINEYIDNNKKNESFRNNIIYINFNNISFTENDYENKIKLFCKQIYYKLSQQFVNYINLINIKPLDSNNLDNKNTQNFIELRKKNIYKKYNIPIFLLEEKTKIINELIDLGFSKELFEYTFKDKLPTFDKHYIISMLNNNKNKFEKITINTDKKNFNNNKKLKIENKEYFRFKDQMLIDERELYFGNKNEKEINNNQDISNENSEKSINEEICNFCKTNYINIIFQNCKHKYSCVYCLSKIKNKICPICKKKIKFFVRIYNNY